MEGKDKFGGFDSLVDTFLPTENESKESVVDPEDIKKQMEELDNQEDKDDDSKKPEVKEDETKKSSKKSEPVDEIDDKSDDKIDNSTKEDDTENKEDVSLNVEDIEETELVGAFADLFAEELKWEYGDEEKPKSMKELVDFMQNVIAENSQPNYATDEVKELDEFVRNGGSVKDYYNTVYSTELNLDKIDTSKEFNQKAIIRENLRNRGYSETRIEKLITRYEETSTMEEEAQDSLEEVKEFREKSKAELLDKQKKLQEEGAKAQHEFISNVEKVIKDSTNIRGIELSSKEKQELFDYIFKPERDGSTKYQKDYNSNLKNLVESAYFTMKGDTLVQQIQKKATTSAAKDLISKLKTKGKSTKNTVSEQEGSNSKVTQLWEIASKELRTF